MRPPGTAGAHWLGARRERDEPDTLGLGSWPCPVTCDLE